MFVTWERYLFIHFCQRVIFQLCQSDTSLNFTLDNIRRNNLSSVTLLAFIEVGQKMKEEYVIHWFVVNSNEVFILRLVPFCSSWGFVYLLHKSSVLPEHIFITILRDSASQKCAHLCNLHSEILVLSEIVASLSRSWSIVYTEWFVVKLKS